MKFEINEIFDLHLNNWLHLLTQYHIFCHLHLCIKLAHTRLPPTVNTLIAVSRFPEYTEKQNIGHDRRNVVKL